MKNSNPLSLVLAGSILLTVITFLTVFIVHQVFSLPLWAYIVFPGGVGLTAFVVFYILVRRFIHERLRLLYRSIRKGKMQGSSPIGVSMTSDVIGEAEAATREWADARHKEISQLREQEAFRREFLGNLAHELKTPVFSIQGYVLTLLDGALEDENVNRMFLERASKAVDRMTHILNDLDDLTKLEVNDLKLELRPFDVRELAREVMESVELRAREAEIKLKISKEANHPFMVVGDRGKIAQVFTNLINNSISYGNKGGVTQVRIYEVDEIVTIEISDNGIGIDPDHIPRLFERFYRVEKSRNRHEGGSGLGLSIVKHILDSHGQTISVRSTVGLGSTFTFSLDRFKGSAGTIISSRGVTIKS